MDKKLIVVYILLILAFIAVYPLLQQRVIWDKKIDAQMLEYQMNLKETYDLYSASCDSVQQVATPAYQGDFSDKAHVIFVFEDNLSSQFAMAYSILQEEGFPASIAATPSQVGQDGYMTSDELTEAYNSGWDLLNHTYHHKHLAQLSEADQAKEINDAKLWMDKHCFTRASNVLVYPYGEANQQTNDLLGAGKYRGTLSLVHSYEFEPSNKSYKTMVRILDPYVEVRDVKTWIDQAIRNKRVLILVNSPLDRGYPSMTTYDADKFKEIVQYLDLRQRDIDVITYSQWLNVR